MIWLLFVIGFPALCSMWACDKVLATRGPEGFKDPGGWKLPLGEVAIFGGAAFGILFVLVIAATFTTLGID